jgi:hypothetical protein
VTRRPAALSDADCRPPDDWSSDGGPVHDLEKEARNRLIDAARCDLMSSTGRQTDAREALDRLSRQAYGDADRLRGAAEQLRRRFEGAEAIPLLEAAARHVEASTEPEPPVHERSDRPDPTLPEPSATPIVGSPSGPGGRSPAGLAHPSGARPRDDEATRPGLLGGLDRGGSSACEIGPAGTDDG